MRIIQNFIFIIKHFINRKLLTPFRLKKWENKHKKFEHNGIKGLKFILIPGEFIDRFIFVEGIYERRFLEFIERTLKTKRTMLDIGANIGNHSIYLSKSFDTVHSFDPNPTVVERLQQNIAINNIENIVVHSVGLGSKNAKLPFNENRHGSIGSSHFQKEESEETVLLDVVRGDLYIEEHQINNIDFVKIDVEGFELEVLEGLTNTIDRYHPVLAFEFHAQDFEENYFDHFRKILKDYTFFELVYAPADAGILEKLVFNFVGAGMPDLRIISDPERRTYENILALPSTDVLSARMFGSSDLM